MNILYTYDLQGDLALLPKLYSWIKRLKNESSGEKTLLFDLGHSCVPEVWPCGLTGGRSTLIVLDGMGYQAANVGGVLEDGEREQLAGNVQMGLVDEKTSWRMDDIAAVMIPRKDPGLRLQICLKAAAETRLEAGILHLKALEKGQLGRVEIEIEPAPKLLSSAVQSIPPGTPPDPTITAAVEFVESEARYYESRR